ncbi:DEHA2E12870p [Debaryomyces hansenii CBS767]|uniref:DEHA2E12870p n=1 Tax=Debaryomyces hansenii (strain ATCC 36239 / CBS 767 / BCRC 21394 / JCM 1990 / NBRC 0083 / IGC 2968) TaxID=284592 RepID=B5RU02_DEBHA|nr:DEHA2E12870p [Debaryomyces hansenii CBS767]CAR65814.1 DEHA2E12870p [Debaryomyces hansenii CBS767]|eukprot:XP_002770471.1 DEHA2E12870p [Debaryomyces hansenii CBS767]
MRRLTPRLFCLLESYQKIFLHRDYLINIYHMTYNFLFICSSLFSEVNACKLSRQFFAIFENHPKYYA